MGRPLRFVPPASLVEVTVRTIRQMFLLRPSAEVNDVILGVLGRAQSMFGVRIYALIVLSNHLHALLGVDDAGQLASFMAFVDGNIAREIGRLHDWRGRFWERRYRAIVVADDVAAVARLRYILSNGCHDGLVDRPRDWPGVSSVHAQTGGKEMTGTWYDRTAEWQARGRGQHVADGQFARVYQVHLSQLPCWQHYSPARYRRACADLVADIEAQTSQDRAQSGSPCLGPEKVCARDPHSRPADPAKTPAPLVHASTTEIKLTFLGLYAAFVGAFIGAAGRLRKIRVLDFPDNAFPPAPRFTAPPAPA